MATRAARHQRILEILEEKGEVSVEALTNKLQVSPMTVRRDLDVLETAGQLRRVHGGALPTARGVAAFSFRSRADAQATVKAELAAAVVGRIRPGMAISLDTGTTTLAVARALPDLQRLTVLTTSLAIAAALQPREGIDTVLLGGSVRRQSPDLTGPLTEDNLKRFRVNLAIMGADAVTAEGSYTTDINIARVTAAMAGQADQVLVVTDSSKFSRTAFYQCLPLNRIHTLVTDTGCPEDAREWLEPAIPEVVYRSVTS